MIANLRHPGGCSAAPRALGNLLQTAANEMKIRVQAEPRGTADAVAAGEAWAGERPFMVFNSDNFYSACSCTYFTPTGYHNIFCNTNLNCVCYSTPFILCLLWRFACW